MAQPTQKEIEEGASKIFTCLESALRNQQGCLIGRNGTVELETLFYYLMQPASHTEWPSTLALTLEMHAGVYPATRESQRAWCLELLEAIRLTDVIVAGWYAPLRDAEKTLLRDWNLHAPRIPLRSLEPYYVPPDLRWTQLLEGKRVAIVNAFAETAVKQTTKAEDIWPGGIHETLLPPTATWIPIPTGYAPRLSQGRAEWPGHPESWQAAVQSTVQRVLEAKPHVVLIGCGGLGMILGVELKKKGMPCVVLGGATQVLFGIKGQRWSQHATIGRFWNDAWVYPAKSETPAAAAQIEGGCYWGP